VKGYADNLGAPLRAVREDVEREWSGRLAAEEAKRKEADEWATELTRALEKEKKVSAAFHPTYIPPQKKLFRAEKPELINHRLLYYYRHGSNWKTNVVPSRRS